MELQELLDRAEIADVLARYARGADRQDWDIVRSCYHPDAHDDHGLYSGGVDGLIEFLQQLVPRFIVTTHHLGNQLIELDGDVARVETSCLAWYRLGAHDRAERSVVQGLRYLDHLEQRDGRWAIARRRVVFDWEHVCEPAPPSRVDPGWSRGTPGADDPSYELFQPSAASAGPS